MKPLIGLLFQVKDRGVRGTLLQKMSLLSANLDSSTLNSKVFEPMCSGFSDSSAALRELTLKSTLGLVPILTPPNLEKLTRYLVRMQADSEVSIRTNTVIFIAKLASHLTPTAREKMILPAFVRALKDPFAPCRLAVMQVMVGTFEYFDPQGLAGKLLPSITVHLLDSDTNVRKEAFKVCDQLLKKLRVESDKMTHNEQMQRAKQQPTQPGGIAAAPSSGNNPVDSTSYLAGFASWVSSSAQPSTETAPMQPQLPVTPVAAVKAATTTKPAQPAARPPPAPYSAPLQLPSQSGGDDGWDDVDDDDGGGGGSGWGDEDDFDVSGGAVEEDPFASIGMKKSTAGVSKLSIGGGGGGAKKLVLPSKKAAPVAVKKLAVDDDDEIADGWDDF